MTGARFCLLVLFCVCGVATASLAAPSPEFAEPSGKAEAFFNTIIRGDTAKAFDTLLDGSTIKANKPGAASALRQQLETGMDVYGRPRGFTLVEAKSFGTSLRRLVYIFNLEKYPLTFEFFFYQSGQSWLPIDVRFNDKLDVYRYDRVPTATDTPSS